MDIMGQKRDEMKMAFLALKPLERIRRMNAVFNDVISFKAKTAGVSEYEIYRRYLNNADRDRKLTQLMSPKNIQTEEDKDLLISDGM